MDIMIDFVKVILSKVSFDRQLFYKELVKGLKLIPNEEIIEFKKWCYAKYYRQFPDLLNRVFTHQIAH
jgi:hypothetical protein